jgi:hypothetical protein
MFPKSEEDTLMQLLQKNKLNGKINYFEWKRHFSRVAKAKGIWTLFSGGEFIIHEPQEENYYVYTGDFQPNTKTSPSRHETPARPSRIPRFSPNTPSKGFGLDIVTEEEEDEEQEHTPEIDWKLTLMRLELATKKYDKQKSRIQQCHEMFLNSLSSGIAIELEDVGMFQNPQIAFTYLQQQYGVSDEKARDQLMQKVNALKLYKCDNMTDFLNKHRELKHDLINAGMLSYMDSTMIHNVFSGLPAAYNGVREYWDWMQAIDASQMTWQILFERLLLKEAELATAKKTMGRTSSGSASGGTTKKDLKCTYDKCGLAGHDEDHCWKKHPDLRPQQLKDRDAKNDKGDKKKDGKPKTVVAMARIDASDFEAQMQAATNKANGTPQAIQPTPTRASSDKTHQAKTSPDGKEDTGSGVGCGCARADRDLFVPCFHIELNDTIVDHNIHDSPSFCGVSGNTNDINKNTWLLDGGTNVTVVNDKQYFTNFVPFDYEAAVANKHTSLKILGGGRVEVDITLDGDVTRMILNDVAYAPDAHCNLVSMSALARKGGINGRWDHKRIVLTTREGEDFGEATICNGLYHLQIENTWENAKDNNSESLRNPLVAAVNYQDKIWKWHRRLGHLGWENLKLLISRSDDIDLTEDQVKAVIKTICPTCAVTRALVKIPRDPARRRAKKIGQLIHVDQWGPYPVAGYDGEKFCLIFVDDAERFVWRRFYATPGDMPKAFKSMHNEIEMEHGVTIRAYRFDGQFQVGPVAAWLEAKHVATEPTVPYQHHMAGVAERTMRTIREKAAPMAQEVEIAGQIGRIIKGKGDEILRQTTIPEQLWVEAWSHAIWLKNRSPTRARKDKSTPWEGVKGTKPSMRNERVWGSRAYVTLPPEKGRDFARKIHDPRGWMGYWVGNESESVCRIFSTEKRKVFRVSVARVDEDEGLDDPHDDPSINDRTPVPLDLDLNGEEDDGDSENEEGDSDGNSSDGSASTGEDDEAAIRDRLRALGYQDSDEEEGEQQRDEPHWDDDFWNPGPSQDAEDDNNSSDDDNADAEDNNNSDAENNESINTEDNGEQDNGEQDSDAGNNDEPNVQDGTKSRFFMARRKEIPPPKIRHDKCDACWKEKRVCDGKAPWETKCSHCVKRRMKCVALKPESIAVFYPDGPEPEDHADYDHKKQPKPPKIRFDRCDYCWRQPRECNGARPCTTCIQERRAGACVDLLPETIQRFYPEGPQPEDYFVPKIQHTIPNPKVSCRWCFQKKYICTMKKEGDESCFNCKSRKEGCIMDLTETELQIVSERRKSRVKALPPGVPESDDTCDRCTKLGWPCDGGKPCYWCKRDKSYRNRCRTAKEGPSCSTCRTRARCDKMRPCLRCVGRYERGTTRYKTCTFVDQDGLVLRRYTLGEVNEDQESDGECLNCIREGRHCDGEKPCHICVKRKEQPGNRSCTYRHKGYTESFTTLPWEATNQGPNKLVDNWEEILKIPAKFSQVRARSQPGNVGGRSTDGAASQLFREAFPYGSVKTFTSGEGLMCGIRATIHSIKKQQRHLPVPTEDRLLDVYRSEQVQGVNRELQEEQQTNDNNFFIDQLGAILFHWGQEQGHNLRLGYVLPNGRAFIIGTPRDHEEPTTIWIATSNTRGATGDNEMDHYTGLKAKLASQIRKKLKRAQDKEDNKPDSTLDDDIAEFATMMLGSLTSDISEIITLMTCLAVAVQTGGDPQSYAEAMRDDPEEWQKGIDNERQSLEDNEVFEIADLPAGRRAITSRWVFKKKIGHDNKVKTHKARLVARGFQQEEGIDYEETFATVVKASSYKLLLALAALLGLPVYLMDVKTAFLHGWLDEEIFMRPPPGFRIPKGKVLRLKKSLYGLKQSPRQWYAKLRQTLEKMGFRASTFDGCVFIHNSHLLIVAVWVDDLMIVGKRQEVIDAFRAAMAKVFKMTDEGLCQYYLGMNIEQTETGINVYQETYIQQMLTRYNLVSLIPAKTPMKEGQVLVTNPQNIDAEVKSRYQSMVGSLLYLSNGTRPDIAFAVNMCARFTANPSQDHMDAVVRIFAYIGGTKRHGIKFRRGDTLVEVDRTLRGYVDSDYAGCPETRRSTTGYVFMLAGAPVSWASRRQNVVATATMEAEYMAAADAAKEAIWLRRIAADTGLLEQQYVTLLIDNESALRLSKNPENHRGAKHIDIRHHFLRERVVQEKDIKTIRVDTKDNISDILSKPLGRLVFEKFVEAMGMRAE